MHIQPKGTGLVTISDGTDFSKGIRFRSSSSAASAVTLLDAVSSAGRVVTLPDATTTLVGRGTTDTLTNKSISGATNTLSNIGNASLTNSTISGVALGGNLFNLTAGTGVSFSAGTTYNGSAAITINATGTGGTVTSVAALTLGTTGTDLSSTVANGTTTPVITLQVPTASAANRGALSAADWTTFNNKQPAGTYVTNLTGPITSVGNATSIASQTGTGTKFVVDNTPTLITPVLGVATATSINKMAITAPATSSTLTVADGKTHTVNNSIALSGTDSTTMTFPTTSATIARTDAAQTFTGAQTFSSTIGGATTIGVGAATPSASGAGITFPATQSDSTDVNTLDDYEEGDWTPEISFAVNTGVSIYAPQTGGRYTKIGRQVHVQGRVTMQSIGTASGTMYLSPFPFTAGSGYGSVSVLLITVDGVTFNGTLAQGTAYCDTSATAANCTNTSVIRFSLTYSI